MQDRVYAGFFIRLAAFIIDMLIVQSGLIPIRIMGGISAIMTGGLGIFSHKIFFAFTIWTVLSYLITSFYFVSLTFFNGQTIGKMALGIKVVSTEERNPSFFEIIIRELFGKYLSSIMEIGYLMIGPDKEKRGLHDRLADTRVVYIV